MSLDDTVPSTGSRNTVWALLGCVSLMNMSAGEARLGNCGAENKYVAHALTTRSKARAWLQAAQADHVQTVRGGSANHCAPVKGTARRRC